MIGKEPVLDGHKGLFEKWEHNEVNILTREDLLSGDVREASERNSNCGGKKTDGTPTR